MLKNLLGFSQDALALQKSCSEKRANSRDVGSLQTRVRGWLDGELELLAVKIQAKRSLATLREDRKAISGMWPNADS